MRFIIPALLLSPLLLTAAINPVPWTASRIHGSPDPPKPYVSEPVFPDLKITQGLEMKPLAGRLYVMQRAGRIWSFPEDRNPAKPDLFVDLKALHPEMNNAYGLAFHPDWRRNRQVFLAYTMGRDLADGTRLSRFRCNDSTPPQIEPGSEEVLLTWRSGGHNGANLQFGSDGMLYVSTGDATAPSPPDSLNTGQDNSDLLSSILRIDVNGAAPGRKYRIPPDNPFVGRENVRPEIWAFGFRNPWKMSFDRHDRLWCGDVGWELWEMIHLVRKGGNYGWSAMEASQPIRPATASPLAPISAPMAAHPHTEAASITGGFVYEGSRLPKLRGAYIYGDYETGKIWALWHDGERVERHEEIADTPHRISTFGLGNDGELYYLHYGDPTTFHRLIPNPRAGRTSSFPRRLSETGLFRNTAKQIPNPGVHEFAVYEPMWQDGAVATRYIALANRSRIDTEIVVHPNGGRRITVTWPPDAVLAKTIRLGIRPVETQILHHDGEAWNAYSYRWNPAATDADLVAAAGAEFAVPADSWQGGSRYRISGRAQCQRCHNVWNGYALAFQPVQIAPFPNHRTQPAREVAVALGLTDANYFERNTSGHLLASRGAGSREQRARSWLHANCSHCHRRHGGGSAPLEVNFERALSESATLWQPPTRGDFGLTDARVIIPAHPERSVLLYRVGAIGSGHMPPLGSYEVDAEGVKLLRDWISKLPAAANPPTPGFTAFDPRQLTDTSSAMALLGALDSEVFLESKHGPAIQAGLAAPDHNIRALFERFRPPDQRPRPTGPIDAGTILRLTGNAERGAQILSPTGQLAGCLACHKIAGNGGEVGPDLTQVGSRLKSDQLLESLTAPSKTIAPEYRVWTIETTEDESHTGFIVSQSARGTTLKLATGQSLTIPATRIAERRPQSLSLMPEGLLQMLTAQEAADVLARLASLKK